MKVKELETVLRALPVAGSVEYPGYITDERLKEITDIRRKNGLSKRYFRAFCQQDGKVLIWRLM